MKISTSLQNRNEISISIDFVHKITFLSHFRSDMHVQKVARRRNRMPDFRETCLKICARLESKKSASLAVKKFCAAERSRNMWRGGQIDPPPSWNRVNLMQIHSNLIITKSLGPEKLPLYIKTLLHQGQNTVKPRYNELRYNKLSL